MLKEEMEVAVTGVGIIPQANFEEKVVSLKDRDLFQEVNQFLKVAFGKDVTYTEYNGLHFEIENPNAKSELHILDDPANFVSLSYGLSESEDGRTYEQARFQVVEQEEDRSVIRSFVYNQDTKKFKAFDTEYVEGDLTVAWTLNNERKKTGVLEDLKKEADGIEAQGFGDFCLPGGYQYCGQKCGSCKSCTAGGGGAIKNKVDGCCHIHDYCYSQNSTNRCTKCDKSLVNCVTYSTNYREGPIAADAIEIFFTAKCLFA